MNGRGLEGERRTIGYLAEALGEAHPPVRRRTVGELGEALAEAHPPVTTNNPRGQLIEITSFLSAPREPKPN